MAENFDVVVIGAGCVAAIRAAQLKQKAAIVDQKKAVARMLCNEPFILKTRMFL